MRSMVERTEPTAEHSSTPDEACPDCRGTGWQRLSTPQPDWDEPMYGNGQYVRCPECRRTGKLLAPSPRHANRGRAMTTESTGGTRRLADGNELPMLGLGVWRTPYGRVNVNAVRSALDAGYRHVDTAQGYGNEVSVGIGLRESGVPRSEVFVTTKFFPQRQDPVAELETSLKRLGLDHVDLYLVHWPAGRAIRAWPRMELAQKLGLTRSIGVSNFDLTALDELMQTATTPPVVNQVQFNPFAFRRRLLAACETYGIVLEAYSSLGTGAHLADPTVAEIARRLERTPAQVLLRWAIQHDVPVIPKSTHEERIAENGHLFDFTLGNDDMSALDALDRTGGTAQYSEDEFLADQEYLHWCAHHDVPPARDLEKRVVGESQRRRGDQLH
jgi:diketogulonate reductase-like aldo/keto reductase